MKKIILFVSILILISINVKSQYGWYKQDLGGKLLLTDIFFIAKNNGWVCGTENKRGVIFKKNDDSGNLDLNDQEIDNPIKVIIYDYLGNILVRKYFIDSKEINDFINSNPEKLFLIKITDFGSININKYIIK